MRPDRFRFAEFELDATSGELSGPAGRQRLEPQPARVLAILLERAGELVTREELQRAVWPDLHVDLDQGLNYCIRQIRSALGETAEGARFVETLPRRGYRFVAPVQPREPVESRARVDPASTSQPPAGRSSLALGAGGLLLVALVAVWWTGRRAEPVLEPAIRVAVLPFHGLDRPATAWEEQLTEAIVVALTERGGERIAVIGPATTAPLAGEGLPQGELGSRLGVDFVLSGGIRSDGETHFAQLLSAPGGEHLWAITRPLTGPDAAGRDIATAALAALEASASRSSGR